MKLITEDKVSSEIKRIFGEADEIKIAVAYWGEGALSQIGGLKGKAAKVICNLDSGACNPAELERVGDVSDLKTHPQLHAKVYWTRQAVIIGSSNASTNGLWGEPGAFDGWREANVLSTDPSLIAEVETWFEERWDQSIGVTDELLKAAQPLWAYGQRRAASGAPLQTSIFDAHLKSPDHPAWNRVKVAFTTEGLTKRGEKDLADAVKETAALEDAFVYEGWPKQFQAEDIVIDVDGIDVPAGSKKSAYDFSFALAGPTLVQGSNLTYLWPSTSALVLPFGRFKLSQADTSALLSIFDLAMALPQAKKEGGVVISIARALELMKSVKAGQ